MRLRRRTFAALALIVVAALALALVGRPYEVSGHSMEPALADGDWVFLGSKPPRHGDVVVFREPDSGHLAVKRVAGEPGEGVRIVGADLWADGAVLARPLRSVEDLVPMIEASGAEAAEHLDLPGAGFVPDAGGWSLAQGEARAWLRRPPLAQYLLRGAVVAGSVPASDLGLECEYRLDSGGAELFADLRIGRATFRASLLAGGAMVRVEREEPDHDTETLLEQRLDPSAATGRLFFAAVDRRLTLVLDGERVLLDGLPFQPPEPPTFADRPPDFGYATHAGVGGRGPLHLGRVRIGRDVLLDPAGTFGGSEVFHLGPDEFFLLGDNPPHSRDSRHYGAVRRSAILGVVRTRWGGGGWTERGWRRD